MTETFNFKIEVEEKVDNQVYEFFMDSFDCLPIAALIDNKIIAVHGGISPELQSIKMLNKLNRFVEIPKTGLVT